MASDPHNIHERVEGQIDLILQELEQRPELYTMKERLSVVQIVSMYLTRSVKLNEAGGNEPVSTGGSAIHKYTAAFKVPAATNAVGGGGRGSRSGRAAAARPTLAFSDDEPDSAAD